MGKKAQLLVFDFDGTLIPYDSFRKYLKYMFVVNPLLIGLVIVLRVLRIISSSKTKELICRLVEKDKRLQANSFKFANKIVDDIDWHKHLTDKYLNPETIVLILSASPICYMKYIENLLNSNANNLNEVRIICSDYYCKHFIEMYGYEKLSFLEKNYSKKEYEYLFAMSDSKSDMCWMSLFKNYYLK